MVPNSIFIFNITKTFFLFPCGSHQLSRHVHSTHQWSRQCLLVSGAKSDCLLSILSVSKVSFFNMVMTAILLTLKTYYETPVFQNPDVFVNLLTLIHSPHMGHTESWTVSPGHGLPDIYVQLPSPIILQHTITSRNQLLT